MERELIKDIKGLLKEEVFKYKIEREEVLPTDSMGNARLEYMTYLTLNNVYELLSQIGQNLGTIILEPNSDKPTVKAFIDLECWVMPNEVMVEIIRLLNKIENSPIDDDTDMGDIDLDITA